uniref:Putative casein kinase II subunit beta-4 isoform X2 n=1 Tax=Davidia involucrata TaxID=16924 RepID=A0A5B6YWY0_DAVIN
MYRERGGGGSKSAMGHVDRKRINDALDKHLERSSPSTSRGVNGKDKDRLSAQSILTGKPPPDQRDPRSASLAENKCSDGHSLFLSLRTHTYAHTSLILTSVKFNYRVV